ncbi:MAG: hypothetical protein LPH20_13750, partial [Shewanella sp.]|nr:hypothetical protein [Shewanella sp.]
RNHYAVTNFAGTRMADMALMRSIFYADWYKALQTGEGALKQYAHTTGINAQANGNLHKLQTLCVPEE